MQKADGARALAVRIEWEVDDESERLIPIFHYDNPLSYTGERDMAPFVRRAFQYLGKENVTDINPGVDIDEVLYKK